MPYKRHKRLIDRPKRKRHQHSSKCFQLAKNALPQHQLPVELKQARGLHETKYLVLYHREGVYINKWVYITVQCWSNLKICGSKESSLVRGTTIGPWYSYCPTRIQYFMRVVSSLWFIMQLLYHFVSTKNSVVLLASTFSTTIILIDFSMLSCVCMTRTKLAFLLMFQTEQQLQVNIFQCKHKGKRNEWKKIEVFSPLDIPRCLWWGISGLIISFLSAKNSFGASNKTSL